MADMKQVLDCLNAIQTDLKEYSACISRLETALQSASQSTKEHFATLFKKTDAYDHEIWTTKTNISTLFNNVAEYDNKLNTLSNFDGSGRSRSSGREEVKLSDLPEFDGMNDADAENMEEDIDGEFADINSLNYDDLDNVSKLQKSQRYIDIMQKVEDALQKGSEISDHRIVLEDDPEYQLIVDCNALSVDIENEIIIIHNFIRDNYRLKFPELESLVHHPIDYARVVKKIGNEVDLTLVDLEGLLPSTIIMVVSVTASTKRLLRNSRWLTMKEAIVLPPWITLAVRLRPGVWEYIRVNVDALAVEELNPYQFLHVKEELVDGAVNGNFVLKLDFKPFTALFPKPILSKSIGNGVEFLNRNLSAKMFHDKESMRPLLDFLRCTITRARISMVFNVVILSPHGLMATLLKPMSLVTSTLVARCFNESSNKALTLSLTSLFYLLCSLMLWVPPVVSTSRRSLGPNTHTFFVYPSEPRRALSEDGFLDLKSSLTLRLTPR
ncbi:U4/U6 small nuclear ribonucleoprotein Prp31-like protein [Bienertia sinuspersici]